MRSVKKERMIVGFTKAFAKYGLDGTSMKKLAAKANVTESLIYRYFENKDDIIKTCTAHYHGLTQRNITAIELSCVGKMELLPDKLMDYLDQSGNLAICRFLLQVMAHPVYRKSMDETIEETEQQMDLFADALAEEYGISQQQACSLSRLINSTINDYILRKSRENYESQMQVLLNILSGLAERKDLACSK